jgi:hypothetical protein
MDHIINEQGNEIRKLKQDCRRLELECNHLKKNLRSAAHDNLLAIVTVALLTMGLLGVAAELSEKTERARKLYVVSNQCEETVHRCSVALDNAIDVIIYRCPSEQPNATDARATE